MSVATLKCFQQRALDELEAYFKQLTAESGKRPSRDAWESLGLGLNYKPQSDPCGRDVPNVCLKVPTGGGKTLLAIEAIGAAYGSYLRDRRGAGLVVWIVPSQAIYKQTLQGLRTEGHLYHEMLTNMTGAIGIDVWEKEEVRRMTPTQLTYRLNVLLLMVQSAAAADKEARRLYRDSGGNIVKHFPAEDDLDAHRRLKADVTNLEQIEGTDLVKTSVGNLIRICRPLVILDEQHKFTTPKAREAILGFNPAAVVEFSATPKDANVLVKVTGRELLDEHMIKLPMNIMSSGLSKWEDCLDKARVKRNELAELAGKAYTEEGRYLRPIVLVQVERTGDDQRGKGPVHSEDVREYLIDKCAVPARCIAVKSSAKDEIEDAPLLDEGCPIEYIITKQALQEGWDCPFAYVLVTLNEAGSKLAMTQLIGRVLRQPDQTPFNVPALNESYVYCLHRSAAELGREVKTALEKEGYEGDSSLVRSGDKTAAGPERRPIAIQQRFQSLYKDFDGTIYLPYFCVRDKEKVVRLNYYEHLIRNVDPMDFDFSPLAVDISADALKEDLYRATLGQKELDHVDEWDAVPTETPEEVRSWLAANLNFAFFSFRQLRALVAGAIEQLATKNPSLNELLARAKYSVRDRIKDQIELQINDRAKAVFDRLFDEGRLVFFLEKKEGRYRIPKETRVRVTHPLHHHNGNPVAKNLFDYADEGGMNEYEKSVALYLDSHPEILWWFRNRVGPEHFLVQGWEERRIYPDFIAARGDSSYPEFVYVVESKGKQLKGADDTVYKEEVAAVFDKLGQKVTWEDLGEQFSDRVFRFQVVDQGRYKHNWDDRLKRMLGG